MILKRQNIFLFLLIVDTILTIFYTNDSNLYYLTKGLNISYFFLFVLNSKVLKFSFKLIAIFFSIIISFIFSSFAQNNLEPILYISKVILFIFPLYFFGNFLNRKTLFKWILSLQFINLSTSLYGYLINDFTIFKYSSLFTNSNTSGLTNCFVLTINVLTYIKFNEFFNNKNKLIFAISSINSILLVSVSNNRLSFLLLFVSLIIYLFQYFYKNLNISNNKFALLKISRLKPYFLISSIIILFAFFFPDIFYNLILKKTVYLVQQNDFTNGRSFLWNYALNNFSLFGNISDKVVFTLHSQYLSILIRFGFIPAFLFFLPYFYFLINIIIRKRGKIFLISFFLLIQILLMWSFETKFITITNLFFTVMLGYENKENKELVQSN